MLKSSLEVESRLTESIELMFQTLAQMLVDIGLQQLMLVWLIVVFAAVMRAFTGFGFALAAVPAFSLLMAPTQAVVLSVMLTLAVTFFTLKTFWGQYPVKSILPMIICSLLGTAAGAFFLKSVSAEFFQLWIGLSVIAACGLLTFYRPSQREASAAMGGFVGLVSGLMNGLFAIPGPPVVVYAVATQADPGRARALLMTFFLFSASFGLVSYSAAGYVNAGSVWLFALSLPAMYLGDKLGYRLFRRYGTRLYRRVALVVLFGVGVVITGRVVLG